MSILSNSTPSRIFNMLKVVGLLEEEDNSLFIQLRAATDDLSLTTFVKSSRASFVGTFLFPLSPQLHG